MNLFISSSDYCNFNIVRTVLYYEIILIDDIEMMLIETNIPIIGQPYGLGALDPSKFYVANRYIGAQRQLKELKQFPIEVYVYIVSNTSEYNKIEHISQLQNIAWACLYDNETDATQHRVY